MPLRFFYMCIEVLIKYRTPRGREKGFIMSIKPRQFTDAQGNTVYVNMSKKEYKAALKQQKAAYEAAKKAGKLDEFRAGTWQPEGYQATNLKGKSIFAGQKASLTATPQNGDFAGTSLAVADGKVDSKKDYKAKRDQYEATLLERYKAENEKLPADQRIPESRLEKIAAREAKELVESEKAADEVLAAKYFTPDQKEEYKQWKKDHPDQAKHAVLLEESDMERLSQFDDLKGFVTTENGKRVITEENQLELKKAAAKHVGDDNKLDYNERFDQTRVAKGLNTYKDENGGEHTDSAGVEGRAISHGSARKTKNLFKHLGFDHAHDYTETLITAGVASAAAGAAIGEAIVTGGFAGAGLVDGGGGIIIPAIAGSSHLVEGLAIGAAAGAIPGAASQLHANGNKVPAGKIDNEPEPVVSEPPAEVSEPPAEVSEPPAEVSEPPAAPMPKLRGRAVDEGLKKRVGYKEDPDWDKNPMVKEQKAQYVLANEDGEVEIPEDTEDITRPATITFHDNTNDRDKQNVNTYTYRLITDEEIKNGKLSDGTPIKTGGGEGPFYVLESATKADGTNIKSRHAEVFKLQPEYNEDKTMLHYNLRQSGNMSGANRSSIDYQRRGLNLKG